MVTLDKIPVLNPLLLRNTVGAELVDIFEARGFTDIDEIVGVKELKSKEKLSKHTLQKAADTLECPEIIEYLENFQKNYAEERPKYQESYKQAKQAYAKLKKVLPLLRGEFTEGFDLLDDIFDYFGVDSEQQIYEQSERQAVLFRQHNKVAVDPINLSAWLRRGELDFEKLNLIEYNEEALKQWVEQKDWEHHIEDINYFNSLPALFATFGVGLIYVPYLEKTVYGAIRWIDNKPLIQISDRGHDLISCWFTLFHEIGHALLHKNEDIYEGEVNSSTQKNRRETAANKFANKHLFNGDDLRKAVFHRKQNGILMTATALAEEFNVKPILASYWLLKAQYNAPFQRRIQIDFTKQYQ